MAMRQRTGVVISTAPPQQSVRPVYEDFQPKTEQKEEATETIIQVHLPGFVKERIKITYVNSSRTLRIQGERPRLDNRWSRFNKTFSVPENCDVDKIQAKFLSGILTITMPKNKIIARVSSAAEDKTGKAAPILPKSSPPSRPEQIPAPTPAASTSGVEKQMEEKLAEPSSLKGAPIETKVEKGSEDVKAAFSTAINEGQRVVESIQSRGPPEAITAEPKTQKGQDLAPSKSGLTADTQKQMDNTRMESSATQVDQKAIQKKDVLIVEDRKAGETKEPEKNVESKMVKGRESGEKSRDSVMPENTAQIQKAAQTGKKKIERSLGVKEEKPKKDSISEKGMGLKNVMGSAKQRLNDLAKGMNEDDRKMLINIGAAVVVLVALGAYVSYSYGSSSRKSEN